MKWTSQSHNSFDLIKNALTKEHVLISPNYSKEFLIFSFASEHTIATVLLQKNDEGFERPIAFFRKSLRDAELKYDILEK